MMDHSSKSISQAVLWRSTLTISREGLTTISGSSWPTKALTWSLVLLRCQSIRKSNSKCYHLFWLKCNSRTICQGEPKVSTSLKGSKKVTNSNSKRSLCKAVALTMETQFMGALTQPFKRQARPDERDCSLLGMTQKIVARTIILQELQIRSNNLKQECRLRKVTNEPTHS